jgi:hypothetical protein
VEKLTELYYPLKLTFGQENLNEVTTINFTEDVDGAEAAVSNNVDNYYNNNKSWGYIQQTNCWEI